MARHQRAARHGRRRRTEATNRAGKLAVDRMGDTVAGGWGGGRTVGSEALTGPRWGRPQRLRADKPRERRPAMEGGSGSCRQCGWRGASREGGAGEVRQAERSAARLGRRTVARTLTHGRVRAVIGLTVSGRGRSGPEWGGGVWRCGWRLGIAGGDGEDGAGVVVATRVREGGWRAAGIRWQRRLGALGFPVEIRPSVVEVRRRRRRRWGGGGDGWSAPEEAAEGLGRRRGEAAESLRMGSACGWGHGGFKRREIMGLGEFSW